MKIFKTLPEDSGFFRIYARFSSGIAAGVILAQIISGLTEAGLIYESVEDALRIFGPDLAGIGAALGAIVGVLLIEIAGLRFFLPQSIDAVLYRRFSGLHLPITIFCFVMTAALVAGSFVLSLQGGREMVDNALYLQHDRQEADLFGEHHDRNLEALAKFQQDTTALRAEYAALIEAEREKMEAAVLVAENDLQLWQGKQERTGRNYESRVSAATGAIRAAQADFKRNEAQLLREMSERLREAAHEDREREKVLFGEMKAQGAALQETYEAKNSRYGIGAGIIIIIAVLFSIVGIILQRIFHKGSGIEETPITTDYFFRPGVLQEWYFAISERFQQRMRTRIHDYITRTHEPPPPSRVHTLYDKPIDQPRRRIGFNIPPTDNPSVITQPLETDKGPENDAGEDASVTHTRTPRMKPKNCLHCGAEYTPKVSWQKFCAPTCKDAFHAAKHGGQTFNPGQYHGKNGKA